MSSVTVSLYGGLGNQLFQYASARALAERTQSELILDLAWFDLAPSLTDVTTRNYALSPFNISARLQSKGFSSKPLPGGFGRILNPIRRLLEYKSGHHTIYAEHSFRFDPDVLTLHPPVWLNGYWQSPKYFEDAAPIIRKEIGTVRTLNPQSEELYRQIADTEAICMHVRRGDYVTNKKAAAFHGLCSLDYYRLGLEIASSDCCSPHCYVFSDDPSWVVDNFQAGMEMTVVDVNGPDDAHQDLWLMSACKNFVIANSSLSWWGAWLGSHVDKVVVAPKQWFLSGKEDASDLIPEKWVRI